MLDHCPVYQTKRLANSPYISMEYLRSKKYRCKKDDVERRGLDYKTIWNYSIFLNNNNAAANVEAEIFAIRLFDIFLI